MLAAQTQREGRPSRRPWRAAKRRAGRATLPDDSIVTPAPQDPLDFALAFMRDDSKPDALRISVAKAALPYLHKRGAKREKEDDTREEPKSEPMSDLELARRIAHILARGKARQEREAAEKVAVRNEGGREAGGVPPSAPTPARSLSSGRALRGPVGAEPPPQAGEGEARTIAPRDDPFDPHPGYRWI
jgi:hypothetical protein